MLSRGYQEKILNNILDLTAAIGKGEKEGTRDDYVETLWEGVHMAKNTAKTVSTLSLQGKEVMDQLKIRSITDIANIKLEFWAFRKGVKRLDWGIVKMSDIQRELYAMRLGMANTNRLEFWSQ